MELTLGLLMGFAYMASPGPMMTETLRRGAVFGFPAAFAVQAGGMVGRIFYALIVYTGIAQFLTTGALQGVLSFLSFILLLYLGWSTIKERNLFSQTKTGQIEATRSISKTFLVGCMMSVFNPLALAFWISLSSQSDTVPVNSTLFLVGFFGGLIIVGLGLVFIASYWLTRVNVKWLQFILTGCGLVLIGFGLKVGYSLSLMLI